ncbi:hypothetical protein SPFM12_00293 [Salmonella phage SPFM12]|nr:hypothetical protein SPFM12_00293 [Salmonella phage SPFM12]
MIESLYPGRYQTYPEQHQAAFGAAVSLLVEELTVDQFAKETSVDTTFLAAQGSLQEDTLEPLGNWELVTDGLSFAFAYIIGVKTRDPSTMVDLVLEASNLEIDETQIRDFYQRIANQYSATRFYEHVREAALRRFAYR